MSWINNGNGYLDEDDALDRFPGDSILLFALLKPYTIIGECHMRRDED